MIYYKVYKRFEVFLVISKNIRDFGFFYEYKPPYFEREKTHQIRIGLVFIRFYFTILKPTKKANQRNN